MRRSSRLLPLRRASRPGPSPIRGNSSAEAPAGLPVLMCAADDGCVLVGHAVDHPDPAVEVLLMYSSGLHAAAEGRQAPDDRPPRCMLLGLGGLPGDCAENSVVLLDPACAAAEKIPDAEAAAAP